MPDAPLLRVEELGVEIPTHGGVVQAVRGVSFSLQRGDTLALVGESGCGKSVTAQAMTGVLGLPGLRVGGRVWFDGADLLTLPAAQLNHVRGTRIGMVFQDPMSAFNPTRTIGAQIAESLRLHRKLPRALALHRAGELLDECRLSNPAQRLRQYPFELSGGMQQRAMIAMALACEPELLIADEPTTALDVTTQDQVLCLLRALQRERGMALLLITHDLAVVAQMATDVAVMYAGQLVEQASVAALFATPSHPYTRALLAATPRLDSAPGAGLATIEGSPPDLFAPPPGCGFAPRCAQAMRVCPVEAPSLLAAPGGGSVRCWLHHADCPVRSVQ